MCTRTFWWPCGHAEVMWDSGTWRRSDSLSTYLTVARMATFFDSVPRAFPVRRRLYRACTSPRKAVVLQGDAWSLSEHGCSAADFILLAEPKPFPTEGRIYRGRSLRRKQKKCPRSLSNIVHSVLETDAAVVYWRNTKMQHARGPKKCQKSGLYRSGFWRRWRLCTMREDSLSKDQTRLQ